jgi:hypothetical protein
MIGIHFFQQAGPAWRRLFAGVIVLLLARQVSELAVLARVNELGGAIRSITALAFAQATSSFAFALLAGVMITRFDTAKLLGPACLVIGVALLAAASVAAVYPLIAAVAVAAGVTTLVKTLEAAFEPSMLPDKETIALANSLRGVLNQISQILGPVAAGASLAAVGPSQVLLGASAFMLVPALFFHAAVRRWRSATASSSGPPPREQNAAGALIEIARSPDLILFILVEVITVLLLGMQGPLIFTYFVSERGYGAGSFPYLMASLGGGGIIGSLGVFFIPMLRNQGLRGILALLVVDGTATLGFALSSNLFYLNVFMAGMGLLGGLFAVLMRTYVQTIADEPLRNRMIAVYYGLFDPLVLTGLSLLFVIAPFANSSTILGAAAACEIVTGLAALTTWRWLVPVPEGQISAAMRNPSPSERWPGS